MKRSGRLYIIAGVVLALVAGALLFMFLNNQATQQAPVASTPTPRPPVDVVTTTRDLKAGTILTSEMVRRVSRPADDPRLSGDAVRDLTEAIDRVVIIDVKADTLLRRNDLQTLPFILPKGKKAMALLVDDVSSIGGLVRERDYVDVVVSQKIKLQPTDTKATPTPRPRNQETEEAAALNPTGDQTTSKTVIQRVQVLKVIMPQTPQQTQQQAQQQSQQQQAQQVQAGGATGTGTPAPSSAVPTPTPSLAGRIVNAKAIVVLAVTDQEAEVLRFVTDTGALLQILLRGRDDTDSEETKGMTLDILIRDYGLPIPRPVVIEINPEGDAQEKPGANPPAKPGAKP